MIGGRNIGTASTFIQKNRRKLRSRFWGSMRDGWTDRLPQSCCRRRFSGRLKIIINGIWKRVDSPLKRMPQRRYVVMVNEGGEDEGGEKKVISDNIPKQQTSHKLLSFSLERGPG
mmetsp:Transcript_37593/g.53001  ORF Transcript_37593/g.53001 Transcript_37593/m.53001 type:complete len:115 (+) Transcript_37593:295-639(+)